MHMDMEMQHIIQMKVHIADIQACYKIYNSNNPLNHFCCNSMRKIKSLKLHMIFKHLMKTLIVYGKNWDLDRPMQFLLILNWLVIPFLKAILI